MPHGWTVCLRVKKPRATRWQPKPSIVCAASAQGDDKPATCLGVADVMLSEACIGCYAQFGICGFEMCIAPCGAEPGDQACLACLGANCVRSLNACAGCEE